VSTSTTSFPRPLLNRRDNSSVEWESRALFFVMLREGGASTSFWFSPERNTWIPAPSAGMTKNKGPSPRRGVSPQVSSQSPGFLHSPLVPDLARAQSACIRDGRRGAIRPSIPQLEAVKPREAPDNWDTGAVDD
jgi:hypothetical protein